MVSFPRPLSYFKRNDWAGHLRTPAGEDVLDSPLNNATAHYLHNMLYVLGAIGLFFSAWLTVPMLQLAALSLVAFSLFSCTAIFWTLPGRFFAGASAAAGIALINSVGNLGGYIGPFVIGALKEYTGNLASGLYFLSAVMVFGLLLTGVVYRLLERKHVLPAEQFAASARGATRT